MSICKGELLYVDNNAFMTELNKIKAKGIPYTPPEIAPLDLSEYFRSRALELFVESEDLLFETGVYERILGAKGGTTEQLVYTFTPNARDMLTENPWAYALRSILTSVCHEYMEYFIDFNGVCTLTRERLRLLHQVLLNEGKENLAVLVHACLYVLLALELNLIFSKLKAKATKGKLTPTFLLDSTFLNWTICPEVLSPSMLRSYIPRGYTGYRFRKKGVNSLALIMRCNNCDLTTAKEIYKNQEVGFLLPQLTVEQEDYLLPTILGDLDIRFKGVYRDSIPELLVEYDSFRSSGVSPYSLLLKPLVIHITQALVVAVREELLTQGIEPDVADICLINPEDVLVCTPKGVVLSEVLPSLHHLGVELEPLSYVEYETY